jgi:DNA polymerase elongation subunit (family B)
MTQAQYLNFQQYGNNILFRYVDERGKRQKKRVPYKPRLFVPTQDAGALWRSIQGEPLQEMRFDSIKEAKRFREDRTSAGFPVHGFDRYGYCFISELFPEPIQYDPTLVRVGNIDIETGGICSAQDAIFPVTTITYKIEGRIFVLGTKPYTPTRDDVDYIQCLSEKDLLSRFLTLWNSSRFACDIITGWNIEGFDFPYLVNRITQVLGEDQAKRLSPWNLIQDRVDRKFGKEKKIYSIVGISMLDYWPLFEKLAVGPGAAKMPDDWKLNTVANMEVGEKKVDYSNYTSLFDLYDRDYDLFVEYNLKDVELVEKIDNKRQLISLAMSIAYGARVNFEDCLGSVRQWEGIIHHDLAMDHVALPSRPRGVESQSLVGGYVKVTPPSMFKWVVSVDLTSLYPHLMMQFNISPETKRGVMVDRPSVEAVLGGLFHDLKDDIVEKDVVIAANGCVYCRDRPGFLPTILENMYNGRAAAKDKMKDAKKLLQKETDPAERSRLEYEIARYSNEEKRAKVGLNSAYGVLTNKYFILYDFPNAEAITTSGQLAIKWVEKRLNEYLNGVLGTNEDYVIAQDTDSCYLNMGPLVDRVCPNKTPDEITDFLDIVFEEKINVVIQKAYQDLAEYVNATRSRLSMKRESIAERGIWVGKKNYVLNVLDKEGIRYKEPELEMKGVQAIKSSTPSACRTKLLEAIKLIISGTEEDVIKLIDDFREEYYTLPLQDIAFPRSLRGMNKYSCDLKIHKKGSPVQVKAGLLWNHTIKKLGLDSKYEQVGDGDKIKYLYLRVPNPIRDKVIGTPGPIPKEFRIQECVDYPALFQKGFLAPLEKILHATGWKSFHPDLLEFEDEEEG